MPSRAEPAPPAPPALAAVFAEAAACRVCPRMEGRRRLLGPACGMAHARVLLVGTAPGRHGGDRTGIPFHGDRSGTVFEALLARAGLTRADVFVTNAVLCNPRDAAGRNAEPTAAELRACRRHLAAVLVAVPAPLVVALGHTAFRAVHAVAPAGLRFEECLGRAVAWNGRRLAATYHPGPRVVNRADRRRELEQQWDRVLGAGR